MVDKFKKFIQKINKAALNHSEIDKLIADLLK
jgi:hypothetical protein